MPYKFITDKIPMPDNFDRRKKLTEDDKQVIRNLKDSYSQRQLAKMFGVSRRLIQFIIYPEKLEANKQRRLERGGSKLYYSKEYNTRKIREHRRYKQSVMQQIVASNTKE